jgi:hypothetical protein
MEMGASVAPPPEASQIVLIEVDLPPASFEMNPEMSWEDLFHAALSARWVSAVTLFHRDFWIEPRLGTLPILISRRQRPDRGIAG